MIGGLLICFGFILFAFRYSNAYAGWIKKRLAKKGFTDIEERTQKRLKTIQMLGIVYFFTGVVFLMR